MPSPRCSPSLPARCCGFDAAGAGECEALTGRCWRAGDVAQSAVKCVCYSEHNTGLPSSQRGKALPAPHHCCMWLWVCSVLSRLFISHYDNLWTEFTHEPCYSIMKNWAHLLYFPHSQGSMCGFLSSNTRFYFRNVSWKHQSRGAFNVGTVAAVKAVACSGTATRHGCRTLEQEWNACMSPPCWISCYLLLCSQSWLILCRLPVLWKQQVETQWGL